MNIEKTIKKSLSQEKWIYAIVAFFIGLLIGKVVLIILAIGLVIYGVYTWQESNTKNKSKTGA